ncbi:MAG: phosphoenolpyruvate carboxylase [Eggerthella lenta]
MPRASPRPTPRARGVPRVVEPIDALPVDQAQVVVCAFTSFFHLANLSEENYRRNAARVERNVSMESAVDTSNESRWRTATC